MSTVFIPRVPSLSSLRSSFRQLLREGIPRHQLRNLAAVGTSFSVFAGAWACSKRVPGGHVGLLEDWNGNVREELYDDDHLFFFLPIYYHTVVLRLFPVKKRLTRICQTKDKQPIEVCLQIRLQPKIAFCRDIYVRLGRDYARGFVEKEAVLDLDEVVREYTFDQLVHSKAAEYSESASDQLLLRFKDACAFHRLIMTEITVLFKNPNEEEQAEDEEWVEEEEEKQGNQQQGDEEQDKSDVREDGTTRRAVSQGYV
eukprot:GHVS01045052.1.p1 GENE.GHVS01045052.1~~GHVS01045052.1.p1  ORF type:complete len:256 (+),score=54.26 GHVS01045052.1:107-874(+)